MGITYKLKIFPKEITEDSLEEFKEIFNKTSYRENFFSVIKRGGRPVLIAIYGDTFPDLHPSFGECNVFRDLLMPSKRVFGDVIAIFFGGYGSKESFRSFYYEYSEKNDLLGDPIDDLRSPAPGYNEVKGMIEEYFKDGRRCKETIFIFSTEQLKVPWPRIEEKEFILYWNPISAEEADKRSYESVIPWCVKVILLRHFPDYVRRLHKDLNVEVPERFWKDVWASYDIYGNATL